MGSIPSLPPGFHISAEFDIPHSCLPLTYWPPERGTSGIARGLSPESALTLLDMTALLDGKHLPISFQISANRSLPPCSCLQLALSHSATLYTKSTGNSVPLLSCHSILSLTMITAPISCCNSITEGCNNRI